MKYMGSKSAIAKHIVPIILAGRTDQWYVEPFVGGCNSIDKVLGRRIGSDINPYLIEFWRKLQSGWIPPEQITTLAKPCSEASASARIRDLRKEKFGAFTIEAQRANEAGLWVYRLIK